MRSSQAYRGLDFEDELKTTHEEYRRLGLAVITKHEVHKIARRGGGIVYAAKSVSDFTGALTGGRFVAFDAKSLSRPAKTWRPDPRQAHQLEYLLDVTALGGLAFYLVRSGPDTACIVWAEQVKNSGKAELRLCLSVRRRYGPTPWDWLRLMPTEGMADGDSARDRLGQAGYAVQIREYGAPVCAGGVLCGRAAALVAHHRS